MEPKKSKQFFATPGQAQADILFRQAREEARKQAMKRIVTDAVCFSEKCWWLSAKIRCRNCPYIDEQGNIRDERVGGNRK